MKAMTVAERIRRRIATAVPKGTTVTELAKRLGMSRPAFSNVWNGNAELSIELALKIEATFGVNMERLLIAQLVENIEEAKIATVKK